MDRNSGSISGWRRCGEPGKDNLLHFSRRDGSACSEGDSGDGIRKGDRSISSGHREEPLAVYRPDGTLKSEWWFSADGAHRIDGPAYIRHNRDGSRVEHWYLHHRRHRTSGPAIIEWMKDGGVRRARWWIGGMEITDVAEDFLAEAELAWPLDEVSESIFLRRCVGALRPHRPGDGIMRPEPIMVGMCLAGLFWLPVVLTVALLWA